MGDRELFAHQVRNALENLYDPIGLETHPLTMGLEIPSVPGESQGRALRRLLWETIEALRPEATVARDRPEWLTWRVLWTRYVECRSWRDVCAEIGVSESTFFRRQRDGIEAIVKVLWGSRRRSRASTVTSPAQAGDEARRVAAASSRHRVDPGAVTAEVVRTLQSVARPRGVDWMASLEASLPVVYSDPAILYEALLSAMAECFSFAAEGSLFLDVRTAESSVCWTVTGMELPGAGGDRLTSAQGLAVGRALLEGYGGRVWCEPGPQGQVLRVSLPIGKRAVILVIDNDADAIAYYQRCLSSSDYTLLSETHPERALGRLHSDSPDLILLDILMPEDSGWMILQRLRIMPETRSIPVIVCSVLRQPELALSLGAVAVLQKPFAPEELMSAVEMAIRPTDSVD